MGQVVLPFASMFMMPDTVFMNILPQRYLLKAKNYHLLRDQAFNEWAQIICTQNM